MYIGVTSAVRRVAVFLTAVQILSVLFCCAYFLSCLLSKITCCNKLFLLEIVEKHEK